MSWDGYSKSLMDSKNLTSCAIMGLDGSVWTATPNFKVNVDQFNAISNGFSQKGALQASGIYIGDQQPTKFFYLQSDDKQIQGKKGNEGITIAKASKCIIIGTYGDGQQPGSARDVVEKMANYLRDSGF